MKKSIFYICAIICVISAITTCSHAGIPNTRDTSSYVGSNNYTKASMVADTFWINANHVANTAFQTRKVTIENQSTDTLIVWFDNDSTKFKVDILPGKTLYYVTLLRSINTRAQGTTSAIRRQILVKEH